MTTSILPSSAPVHEPNSPPPALQRAADLVIPAIDDTVARLSDELRAPVMHHLAGGGKRVRAALVLLSAAAAGADEKVGIVGAVAIELIHNFSLLHDDIIDEDRERRHRSTAWAEFGVGRAIVAGDALATLALQILLEEPTPERVAATVSLAAATQAMIAGQADDMAFESRTTVSVEECIAMEQGKTGALLACAAALGATLAGAPRRSSTRSTSSAPISARHSRRSTTCSGFGATPPPPASPWAVTCYAARRRCQLPPRSSGTTRQPPRCDRSLMATLVRSRFGGRPSYWSRPGCARRCGRWPRTTWRGAVAALDRVDLAPGPVAELLAIADFIASRDR